MKVFSDVAALCLVYHDDIWLPHAIASVYDVVGKIIFFVSDKPWMGPDTDNSETIRCITCLPDPDGKFLLVRERWATEVEQRNYSVAFAHAYGFRYGMILDADELYEPMELVRMFEWAMSRPETDCFHMHWYTYWKSQEYVISPHENYAPPFLIQFGRCAFIEARNPVGKKHEVIPADVGICHHMSYARSDELIRRKLASFSHAQQIIPNWFDSVWKGWDSNHDLMNLHPVNPPQYQRAIPQPFASLPSVLRKAQAPF